MPPAILRRAAPPPDHDFADLQARFGFTSLPDDEPCHFNLENLIQTQTAHVPATPATGSFKSAPWHFGDGSVTGQF